MVSWTRSHLIDTRYTALRRNLVSINPSFELAAASAPIWTNLVPNPAGVSGGTSWSVTAGNGTYSEGPALGPFTTSARLTRTATGGTRFAIAVPLTSSTTYTVRIRFRASETLTGVTVNLRPDVSLATNQTTLATLTLPAGESEHVLSGVTTSAAMTATSSLAIVLANGIGTVGATLDAVVTLVVGPNDPGYIFSGATAALASPPTTYAWTGTANASASTANAELVYGSAPPGPVMRTRTNLATRPRTLSGNPIFSISGGAGWGGTAPTIATFADATAPTGSGFVTRATNNVDQTTGIGQDALFTITANRVTVTLGVPYTASMYVRPSVTTTLRASIQWLTGGGAGVSSVNGPNTSCPAGVWTRLSVTGTPTAGTIVLARPDIDWGASTPLLAGYTLDADGMQVGQTSFLGTYFDGSTPSSSPAVVNAWTGTVGASTSTQQILLEWAGNGVVPYRSNLWASAGTYSMRLVPSGTTNDTYLSWGAPHWFPWGITPGRTYMIAATRRLSAALTGTLNANAGRIVVWSSLDGATWDAASTAVSTAAPNSAGEQRLSVQVTIPATAVGVAVALYHGGTVNSGDVWWDGLLLSDITGLAPTAVTAGYFDGDRPWARWTGTAHLSTSLGYRWANP